MPDTQFLSQAGARAAAVLRQTYLENSVLHLFQVGITPSPPTTLATLLSNEANFQGYAPVTLATWPHIVQSGGTQYLLYTEQVTFEWSAGSGMASNSIAGTFLVDSTGVLVDVVVFATPIIVAGPDQAVIVTPAELIQN